MRAVIDLAKAFGVDMAVHLRGGEGGVAEELLDGAEVGAAFEQMRREGVTKAMRIWQEPTQRGRVERVAARREKERVRRAVRQGRPAALEVETKAVRGLLAERNSALLSPLAAHVDQLLLEVDVPQLEINDFLRAQSSRVHEFEEGTVAKTESTVSVDGRDQVVGLVDARCVRKTPPPATRERQIRHAAGAERDTNQRAHRSELPRNGRLGELPRLAPRPVGSEVGGVLGEGAGIEIVQ